MSAVMQKLCLYSNNNVIGRTFSVTTSLKNQYWRRERGLPTNKNMEGVLTDWPDYTFLDGRPTPLLHKQKLRMEKQQQYASQIVQLCSEVDFAKDRYKNMLQQQEEERQKIIANQLKPKGKKLLKKN